MESIGRLKLEWKARWVAWRRARNLRQASGRLRGANGIQWCVLIAAGLLTAGAALVIVDHARGLGAAAARPAGTAALDALRHLLGGASFDVPERGARIETVGTTTLAVVSGMRGETPVQLSLCGAGPIRIGYRFEAAARQRPPGQVAIVGDGAHGLPRVELVATGAPTRAWPLALRWRGGHPDARFAGDGGTALRADGWLVWPGGALHLWRSALSSCKAGALMAQLFLPAADRDGLARIAAYGPDGGHAATRLAPGRYTVPQVRPRLEDQALFEALRERAMVRLGANGLVEVVPRDLPAWRAAPAPAQAGQLASWSGVVLDRTALALLERLYRMADGAYVRAQIALFNGERRLLAWRVRPHLHGQWQASVGAAPARVQSGMPLAATRLFADVPQGWASWQTVAAWPHAAAGTPATLTLQLAREAGEAETVELMLAGRVLAVEGASVRAVDACSGSACDDAGAVRVLTLRGQRGCPIALTVAPLDMAAIGAAGNELYRHLHVEGARLHWRALAMHAPHAAASGALAGRPPGAAVTLADRHGRPLWSGGAPTAAASRAGLAALLGVNGEHANSVAGMLARLPGPEGRQARLSLDLDLQALAHAVLDCVGMRQGRWRRDGCSGGQTAPQGRQAGMVVVDTENGDILAAAGAGTAAVTGANWQEVRDFDRANPARSPLRLPAWQHDGGVHRSPGSTFKIVTALGLEQAAQGNAALEALLAGMPVADINALARTRGFAFQTGAATYPMTHGAHITNFRGAHLEHRAQDGRLGLPQALAHSFNTWFAWTGELGDRTLADSAQGGLAGVRALQDSAFGGVRPVAAMAGQLGFGRSLRLDGGLLPDDFSWRAWDALQVTPARIDPIDTRHEVRQMAIGLRMQATPLQMALVAGAVGQGRAVTPRLLLALGDRAAKAGPHAPLGVRLDRVRAGMKGVIDHGTAAGAFAELPARVRGGLFGKTGTAPTAPGGSSTVWFTGYVEPGTLPNQRHRLALAAFVSHSERTGGEHAAPVVAALLGALARAEQGGK